jgi:hypothetical protein
LPALFDFKQRGNKMKKLERLEKSMFGKFSSNQINNPQYSRGGVLNSTIYTNGNKTGRDGYTRSPNSSNGSGGTDDDLCNFEIADGPITKAPIYTPGL